jgi:hypothetical protein
MSPKLATSAAGCPGLASCFGGSDICYPCPFSTSYCTDTLRIHPLRRSYAEPCWVARIRETVARRGKQVRYREHFGGANFDLLRRGPWRPEDGFRKPAGRIRDFSPKDRESHSVQRVAGATSRVSGYAPQSKGSAPAGRRRSDHRQMASSRGCRDRPSGVSECSTLGGTTG